MGISIFKPSKKPHELWSNKLNFGATMILQLELMTTNINFAHNLNFDDKYIGLLMLNIFFPLKMRNNKKLRNTLNYPTMISCMSDIALRIS